jgi:hypothetical protein
MKKRSFGLLAVAGLAGATSLFLSPPGQAHHSFASEFDVRRPVEVQGAVTKARFVNPHSWLYVDVQNADGTKTNWGFEFGSPSVLKAKDVSKSDVVIGSTVRIEGFRAKNGGPFGYAQIVQLSSGREVAIGSAPDAPSVRGSR